MPKIKIKEKQLLSAYLTLEEFVIEEIHFDCSCPDWASMCKHIAALYME